jgi:hypothetical protein
MVDSVVNLIRFAFVDFSDGFQAAKAPHPFKDQAAYVDALKV